MGNYWLIDKNGNKLVESKEYNYIKYFLSNYHSKGSIDKFYFEGDEIDSKFFTQILHTPFLYCVQNSSIQELTIEDDLSNKRIYFNNCSLNKISIVKLKVIDVLFKNCEIGTLDINDCTFSGDLRFINTSSIKELFINESKVSQFKITNCKILKSLITTCEFNGIKIEEIEVTEGISFVKQCCIRFLTVTSSKITELSIITSNIINGFYILDCKSTKLSIIESQFNFDNDNNNEISIQKSSIYFFMDKIHIQKTLTLSLDMNYSSDIYFNRCYFEKYFSFRGPFLIEEDNRISNITLEECVFMDLVSFDYDHAECLKFEKTLFQKGVFIPINKHKLQFLSHLLEKKRKFLIFKSRTNNIIHSSVWCTLKNQAISKNDNINALIYKSYEMDSYSKELRNEKSKYGEKIVLWLNRISNNHGLSWEKGVLFTLVVWLLFYSLFKMSLDHFSVFNFFHSKYQFHVMIFDRDFWPDSFEFLWLPQGIKKLSEETANLSWFTIPTILTFILGKILIAYGIFQTVSAFRKHGKQ